jgi:hypothetical protein
MDKIVDAIRTVGHLLEHHPTTGQIARDGEGNFVHELDVKASCWCYVGAECVVGKALGVEFVQLFRACDEVTGISNGDDWDNLSDKERLAVAKKLQQYTGE